MPWLFLAAYWSSGFAGLLYEVCWTRLLTLYLGHTTAAASAVVGAFLGGLAAGAAAGALLSPRISKLQSLYIYIGLELLVAVVAVVLPYEVGGLIPVLRSAYADGSPGILFPAVRLLSCLVMVFIPAAALGGTFPMAVRFFASDHHDPARRTGLLYALNTTGAATGALVSGFILIPTVGLSATTRMGIGASLLAVLGVGIASVFERSRSSQAVAGANPQSARSAATSTPSDKHKRKRAKELRQAVNVAATPAPNWVPAAVLGLSGFAALIHEIVWTRILSLVLGPTIYAFAATLAAVIAGVAAGSALGTWISGRAKNRLTWLMLALAGAAIANAWTAALAGGTVPHLVAHHMATSSIAFGPLLRQGTLLTAALIVPTAICFGAAFPLALSIGDAGHRSSAQFGIVYAVNTLGAVAGSLLCGFVFIPALGLHATFEIVTAAVIAAVVVLILAGGLTAGAQTTGATAALAAVLVLMFGPQWDRALLASGAYLYAPYVPKDLDLDTQLRAGTLLYDRDGASATVSVKRLTGTLTLAVDGKVDASNRSDMLTQKLLGHVPLLLHDNPHDVAIIGLGSGVTVGSALTHPLERVDVVEISPEVVEASRFFVGENRHALDDPRAHLIVGDGRSHLLLTSRQYDVIISEPSNPWIAGVAALFTREFFEAAKARLTPGGLICQWAHTYNIADADLRSIVGTFTAVFPNGTLWLIGGDDVLLVASNDGGDVAARLGNIERHWTRPGVAADLALVAASEPFSVSSLFAAGPRALADYTAGAMVLTDDRLALEFSGPRALHTSSAEENDARLSVVSGATHASTGDPANGSADDWQRRGAMLFKADAYGAAYRDFMRALTLDFANQPALDGLVRSAVLAGRAPEAVGWLQKQTSTRPTTAAVLVAISKLQASSSLGADALDSARQATRLFASAPEGYEQLASVLADGGDAAQLDEAVGRLQALAPERAATLYFSAVSAITHGRFDEAASLGERAIAADPSYAATYDLVGAAYTKLDRLAEARKAFETSLGYDAHDSTAYTNLGLLDLAAGDRHAAANHFAEALGLAPNSETAREGLAVARR